MCDPVSITLITAAVVSATATVAQGIGQARQASFREQIARQNQQLAQEQGLDEELRVREEARQTLALQTAQLAKAGVRLDEGTPLLVGARSIALAERNALNIRRNARIQAENFRIQAEAASAERRSALLTAGLGAASDLLGGATQLAKLGKFGKTAPTGGVV